jgi:acetoacetate decarboxylase
MRPEQVLQHPMTPLTTPIFPFRPTRFVDREYFNVVYRTDPQALRAIVPEPLGIAEPLVRFEVMKMGDVEGYGPYVESGQVIPVTFNGEHGEYLHVMHLDNFAGVVAGRELSGYPKALGTPRLFNEGGALVGTLDYASQRVATATMGYKWEQMDLAEARAQITAPTFAIKMVLNTYTGQPRVCDLVRSQITDVVVKGAWTGPARLQLFSHVMAPMADLPVLEVISASHILTDLTLSPMLPVHNYLSDFTES